MLELLFHNPIIPKPAGKIFTKAGKSWITMGHEWQNAKDKAILEIKQQLPPGHKPFNRVAGLVMKINLKPSYKGGRKDIFNLLNFPPDVLSRAGVWCDDNETCCDSVVSWISRNNSGVSIVWICENYAEYADKIEEYQATLNQLEIMTKKLDN